MLVRNVGHLMTNPAILLSDASGTEVPEGIMDAAITGADRAAMTSARTAAASQLARGLDLCREAEDARAGGGGLRRRDLRRVEKLHSA
jgi:hypothetical protein